ncbi:MAG: 3-hydroxyacyl-CoA dehydrogenase NAD-binding domain-containing protein [Desulfobacterium sp.]
MENTMTIGVVGAGNMGSGIAQKFAQEGLNVVMLDIKEEFVERGFTTIRDILSQGVKRKIFTQAKMDETMGRIKGGTDFNLLADVDLVIEVVFEDKKIKKELFATLDKICSPKTIFATNTSSFYVSELAESIKRQDRFIGMHYFFHPAKNRLLELIPHKGTSQETIDRTMEISRLHGKTAILVQDSPGFAVNRFFVPLLTESAKLVEEGIANIPTVEHAAIEAFKIGMGPFELMNVTGIPIAVHASTTFGRELGKFYNTPTLLSRQMDSGELWPLEGEVEQGKVQTIKDRLYGACLGAAASLVSEGVASIEDTDLGAKIGLRWQKGPFEIMNQIGIEKTYTVIKAIADTHPDFKMPEVIIKQKDLEKSFEFKVVDRNIKDGVAYITINRPEAMNALNEVTVEQLDREFTAAENDSTVKSIVFQGAGKAFVAGADIRFFVKNIKNDQIHNNVSFTQKGHNLFLRIEDCAKPTIAVLDGLSLGGGSEMALACQSIVATPAGSMGFPETGIGIYPGLGGMLRLAREVGPELAKYYVFTGKAISAQDAYDLGIVTSLVSPQELGQTIVEVSKGKLLNKYRKRDIPERFMELAKTCDGENLDALFNKVELTGVSPALAQKTQKVIERKAPLALKNVNDLIDAQQEKSMAKAIQLELDGLLAMFSTKDALIGLTSLGGSPPQFVGQ